MIQPAGIPIQEFWNRIKACLTAVQRGRIVHLSLEENHPPPPLPDVGSILDVFILVLVLVLVVIRHQPTVHIRTIPRWECVPLMKSNIGNKASPDIQVFVDKRPQSLILQLIFEQPLQLLLLALQ